MLSQKLYKHNGDIISLIEIASEIGWSGIREMSINRVFYLASVLYSFVYPEKNNIFNEDYIFFLSIRGPYFEGIDNSITFLLANDYISEDDGFYRLSHRKLPDMSKLPFNFEKKEWIRVITYILGIYGEEKIYDFIFRDPEYQKSLQSNSIKTINTDKDNETLFTLNKFKAAFEDTIDMQAAKVDAKMYLRLYFEYVFSVIIKGDAEQ